jgi:pyruvate kinase
MKKTKIVATMGPACASSKEVLRKLIKAGVNVCRLNFSHGSHEDHLATILKIREINAEEGLNVSILADLQGPKIRIGEVVDNGVELIKDAELIITTQKCIGTAARVYLTYEEFPRDVKVGDKVLMDDGKLQLEVVSTNRVDEVYTKVVHGGILRSKRG